MALLKSTLTLFIGGAVGVIENVGVAAHGDFSQVDWHKAGFNALVMGLLAVGFHWLKQPNQK